MRKIHVFPFVAFLLLTGCVSQATFDMKAKEADTLVALSDNLQGQVKMLTGEVDMLKKQQAALQAEKAAVEKERDVLSQKAEKAEQLERATQTYQDLQKKLEKEIQEGKV